MALPDRHPISDLHEHRLWTRTRLLGPVSTLPAEALRRTFPMGPGSVLNTLIHLYGAEFAWLAALRGTAAPRFPEPGDFPDLAALLRAWSDLDDQWAAYLATVDEAELGRMVTRTNRAGVTFSTPVQDILIHVCTHAFYHAAQVVNMLRHLGVEELPETNYITMARERAPA